MGLNDKVSAERVHIGFFGLRNAGKSSVVNAVTGQSLSLVSETKGTTTDPVQKAMELNEGTQQQTFEPVNGAISVMRSADGGDLVVAQINSEWTRSAGAGRESQPASDAEKALFGNGKATSTMKTSYVNVIALYVPPANSGQKITAVGSERQPVKVEAL